MRRAPSKYRAKRTTVDGVTFHSMKEAARYQELKLLEKAGQICRLEVQPSFTLLIHVRTVASRLRAAARMMRGESPKPETVVLGRYVADFRYHDCEKDCVVTEDVKGFKTPLYRWKKKHVEAQYGIEVREV